MFITINILIYSLHSSIYVYENKINVNY